MPEAASLYPNQVPECQTPGNTFAQECLGCPRLPDCGYRELAAGNLALLADKNRLTRYVNFLSWDRLMDGYLTLGGFELSLMEEGEIVEALQTDIEDGEAGIIDLDVRGMNMVNLYGHDDVGNVFLQILGYEIRQSVRKPGSSDYQGMERRKEGSPVADLLFVRQGGDEISILMRGIKKLPFERRVQELRDNLSVEQALADSATGIPLIASVGASHATDITLPTTWGEPSSVLSAVDQMRRQADRQAIRLRAAQYDVMLDYVYEREPSLRERYPDPIEDSPPTTVIASKFFKYYFPHFASNVKDVIHAAQVEIESQIS